MYYSLSSQQFQNELHDWHNAHRWIHDCPPHCGCQLNYLGCRYCTHQFCPQHGQFQRIEKANKVLSLGSPTCDFYIVGLDYGTALTPVEISKARTHWHETLQRRCPEIGVLWRLHFKYKVPHIHAIILCPEKTINKVNSNYPIIKKFIKQVWCDSLSLIKHPDPTGESVYCRTPRKPYAANVRYVFQTDRVLKAVECPPKVPYSRWCFYGMNSNYSRHVSVNGSSESCSMPSPALAVQAMA